MGQAFFGEEFKEVGGSSSDNGARSKQSRGTGGATFVPSIPIGAEAYNRQPFMTSLQQYFNPKFTSVGAPFSIVENRMGAVEDRVIHVETGFRELRTDLQAWVVMELGVAVKDVDAVVERTGDEESAESTDLRIGFVWLLFLYF